MAELSKEVQAEGHALVLASNLDALMQWVRKHAPIGLDHAMYEKTMRTCFLAGDVARAIKLHRTVFDTYDADLERGRILVRRIGFWAILFSIIGGLLAFIAGVVALIRWVL